MIDEIKLYRGQDIYITDKIIIKQPTLGEICDFGQNEYLGFVNTFTSTHMDENMIVLLSDSGIDFNNISDWELFILIHKSLGQGSELLFDGLHFDNLDIDLKDERLILRNNDGVIIDETIYKIIVEYLRRMNNISPPKFTRVKDDEVQKQMAIEDAKRQVESMRKKARLGLGDSSPLLPYISYLVNKSGFKHDEVSIFDMKIYPFWDSVKRLIAIDTSEHLYHGLYSGCLDLKKNPSLNKEMDVLRKL